MKLGASTLYGVMSKSVIETVEELEEAGFDTLELVYEYNHLLTDKEIKILKNKKLDFSMHCPFIGIMLTHPNYNFSAPQIELIKKSFDVALEIGCSHCIMHGGEIPMTYSMIENSKTRDFFVDLFIERFQDLFKNYSKAGLKILIENLQFDNEIGGTPYDIIKIQTAIPEIGFCFDIAHSEIAGHTEEIFDKINMDYVHATDNNLKEDEHKVIGKGKIDFQEIFSKLNNKGFDGKIILENLSFEDCRESLNKLKEILRIR